MQASNPSTGLQYVITGSGRSGTTFLSHVFYSAGWDFGGDVHPDGIGVGTRPVGGGMESPDMVRVNNAILSDRSHRLSTAEILRNHNESMCFRWPAVVKDPRFPTTLEYWIAAGLQPRHIFLMVRDAVDVWHSARTVWPEQSLSSNPAGAVAHVLVLCEEHDIPYTVIQYPRIGTDTEYAVRKLGNFVADIKTHIAATWDASLLHYHNHKRSGVTEQCGN